MKLKITKSNIGKMLSKDGKPVFYYDTELKGFGLKANPTGRIYFAEKRVNGKTVRDTITPVGTITPEQARKLAQEHLGLMASGVNLNQKSRDDRVKNITFGEVYGEYSRTKNITPKKLW
ncbi:hypothetical protein FACS1894152_7280 [Bacilli bacterium]|nr:hypothetical protein FACS1894152_7280 [Bacilli bacterium]